MERNITQDHKHTSYKNKLKPYLKINKKKKKFAAVNRLLPYTCSLNEQNILMCLNT
jgi:hypothetical protein